VPVAAVVAAFVALGGRSSDSAQDVYILVDTSTAMGEPFGGGTKLDAAIRSVGPVVRGLEHSKVSLRMFGGRCGPQSRTVARFGFGSPTPGGRSNLVRVVVQAVAELAADTRGDARPKLVVIAGALDTCEGDPGSALATGLSPSMHPSFRFIGLRLSHADLERVSPMMAPFRDARGYFVATERELKSALRSALRAPSR
jgi:hypothetical protein